MEITPVPGARLTVHCLTEFIFCPRAGIICYLDSQSDETDESDRSADLRFVLLDSVDAIRRELHQRFLPVAFSLITVLVLLIASCVAAVVAPIWLLCCGLAVAAVLGLFRHQILRVSELWKQYQSYESAPVSVPDWNNKDPQQSDWWSIIKSGYENRKCHESLVDADWRISGTPHSVLRFGDICIPVFKTAVKRTASGDPILRKQHYARMAAYCHLIQTSIGDVNTPCGVIRFTDSYNVVTVPVDSPAHVAWKSTANSARLILNDYSCGNHPEPPHVGLCSNCIHARLQRPDVDTILGELTYEAHLSLYEQEGRVREHHTCCGDVFQWRPPLPTA